METLISIIIPVYNRQDLIGECVGSIRKQSHQNFEIILIDDGSTDQTVEICRALAEEDPRIRLMTAEHGGVSAARNIGLDAAKGEYVFFIDSDDIIHPLLLETLLRAMRANSADIGGTTVLNILEKHWHKTADIIASDPGPGETTYHSLLETLDALFLGTSPFNLLGGVMMRQSLIGRTRFRKDLFIGEDFYFAYENLVKSTGSIFLKQKWYYCKVHTHNSSRNYSFEAFWSRFYRRELVWKNEEAHGRMAYANCQKREAFNCFMRCLLQNKPYSSDARKMCNVMKQYKRTLFPAMSHTLKSRYYLYVYFPFTYPILFRSKYWLKKLLRRK